MMLRVGRSTMVTIPIGNWQSAIENVLIQSLQGLVGIR